MSAVALAGRGESAGFCGGKEQNGMGRTLVIAGLALVAVGLLVMLLGRLGLPLGKLPGDFTYKGKNVTVFAPLGTCLLVSLVLTLAVWAIGHWRR
jgi:hypothetical protein